MRMTAPPSSIWNLSSTFGRSPFSFIACLPHIMCLLCSTTSLTEVLVPPQPDGGGSKSPPPVWGVGLTSGEKMDGPNSVVSKIGTQKTLQIFSPFFKECQPNLYSLFPRRNFAHKAFPGDLRWGKLPKFPPSLKDLDQILPGPNFSRICLIHFPLLPG